MMGSAAQQPGDLSLYAAVFDGHGGAAVADWLKDKFFDVLRSKWTGGSAPRTAATEACLEADKQLLSVSNGFLGMGERGVGGSKCGSTAAAVLVFRGQDGGSQLLVANVGDARVLLVRRNGAPPVQLTVDHVPDDVAERTRIERFNPNPKMPLVKFMGGTWRVGGLLALSRAFGDAYMKSSLQFEGVAQGRDNGYSSGFGVIAEPHTSVLPLTADDAYLVVSSDGLYDEGTRGGGGGLDNQGVANLVLSEGGSRSCSELAQQLVAKAQQVGSTDDISVVVVKLGEASTASTPADN